MFSNKTAISLYAKVIPTLKAHAHVKSFWNIFSLIITHQSQQKIQMQLLISHTFCIHEKFCIKFTVTNTVIYLLVNSNWIWQIKQQSTKVEENISGSSYGELKGEISRKEIQVWKMRTLLLYIGWTLWALESVVKWMLETPFYPPKMCVSMKIQPTQPSSNIWGSQMLVHRTQWQCKNPPRPVRSWQRGEIGWITILPHLLTCHFRMCLGCVAIRNCS